MSQDTRHLVRDQINVLRDSEQLAFCDLLDERTITGRFRTSHFWALIGTSKPAAPIGFAVVNSIRHYGFSGLTDILFCLAESVFDFLRRYFSARPNRLLSLTLLLGLASSFSTLSGPGGRFGWF